MKGFKLFVYNIFLQADIYNDTMVHLVIEKNGFAVSDKSKTGQVLKVSIMSPCCTCGAINLSGTCNSG